MERWFSDIYASLYPNEVAKIVETYTTDEIVLWIGSGEPEVQSQVLKRITPVVAAAVIEKLTVEVGVSILEKMEAHLISGILRRLPEELKRTFLESLPSQLVRRIQMLLTYAEGTAGALLDSSVLALSYDTSTDNAWETLKHQPQNAYHYVYVVDREQKLMGVLNLRELSLKNPEEPLLKEKQENLYFLRASDTTDAIVAHPGWTRLHTLPVVDKDNNFLGAIRYETLRRLEKGVKAQATLSDMKDVGAALGELYWIGFGGIFEGLVSIMNTQGGDKSR